MKLDIWKSKVSGQSLLSVPAGVQPWSIVERSTLPWDMQEIRLFRRGVQITETPLVSDADKVLTLIEDQGFALHQGSILQA